MAAACRVWFGLLMLSARYSVCFGDFSLPCFQRASSCNGCMDRTQYTFPTYFLSFTINHLQSHLRTCKAQNYQKSLKPKTEVGQPDTFLLVCEPTATVMAHYRATSAST